MTRQHRGGELRQVEQLLDPRRDPAVIPSQVARHERDVVAGRQVREQPAFLDHVPDSEPERASRRGLHRHSTNRDAALVRDQQTHDQAE